MSSLKEIYNNIRKRSLFPTISDIEWRHSEIASRLVQIHNNQVQNKLDLKSTRQESQHNIIDFFKYLQPQKILSHEKVRVGHNADGGYILLDDFNNIKLALSLGIHNEDSWDRQIASLGIPVKQYDYSISQAPTAHPLFSFNKLKVSGNIGDGCITLPDIIHTSGHSEAGSLLLKIDIEDSEWEVFDLCPSEYLSKFRQIACEFHGLSRLSDIGFYTLAKRVVEKLNADFIPFHIHANNYGSLINIANVVFPDVIEISYANRKHYDRAPTTEIFPTKLDFPNNPDLPDIFLGGFQFSSDCDA